jgi:hypothetical protein
MSLKRYLRLSLILSILLIGNCHDAAAQTGSPAPTKHARAVHKKPATSDADIATAVKANAVKDCGCGECAAKGCKPCHGKNCYYCVAKGLTTKECGCGMCAPKGCDQCGPGCDVCKFHLAPLEAAKAGKKR